MISGAVTRIGRAAGVFTALVAVSCGQEGVVLSKTVDVFGVPIIATASVPDAKLLHAAHVLAEYLDNDEDGVADDPLVVAEMVRRRAFLIMFSTSAELDSFRGPFPAGMGQDLQADETHPEGSTPGRFDATLEEVLHLVTYVGYAGVYPEVFGESPGSQVANAMDLARGGRFEEVPDVYPDSAWYSYGDVTCDYSCMVVEYTYWAITSLLGGQSYPGRLERIEHEWRLNTPELLQAGDPAVYSILTDSSRVLPTTLPDGRYAPASFKVRPYAPGAPP